MASLVLAQILGLKNRQSLLNCYPSGPGALFLLPHRSYLQTIRMKMSRMRDVDWMIGFFWPMSILIPEMPFEKDTCVNSLTWRENWTSLLNDILSSGQSFWLEKQTESIDVLPESARRSSSLPSPLLLSNYQDENVKATDFPLRLTHSAE